MSKCPREFSLVSLSMHWYILYFYVYVCEWGDISASGSVYQSPAPSRLVRMSRRGVHSEVISCCRIWSGAKKLTDLWPLTSHTVACELYCEFSTIKILYLISGSWQCTYSSIQYITHLHLTYLNLIWNKIGPRMTIATWSNNSTNDTSVQKVL